MGQFVSAITDGVNSIAQDICNAVTDTGKTIEQLVAMTKQFTPPILLRSQPKVALDSTDVNTALSNAMTALQSSATTAYSKSFPSDSPTCLDNGVVKGYKAGGNLQSVIDQMTQIFSDNSVFVDPTTINAMAKTIQMDVDAQMGNTGAKTGYHYINANQKLEWGVSYGIFAIDQNTNGLVYGFAAAMVSKFV